MSSELCERTFSLCEHGKQQKREQRGNKRSRGTASKVKKISYISAQTGEKGEIINTHKEHNDGTAARIFTQISKQLERVSCVRFLSFKCCRLFSRACAQPTNPCSLANSYPHCTNTHHRVLQNPIGILIPIQ